MATGPLEEPMSKAGKRLLIGVASSAALIAGLSIEFVHSLGLGHQPVANAETQPLDLPLLRKAEPPSRGRILAVVTSTAQAGDSGVAAGFELTELSRAYYTFIANGFHVDIASPRGGNPPVVIDEDLNEYDHAFINDADAQRLLRHSVAVSQVDPGAYSAVYFVGGKGAMFDFPGDPHIHRIVRAIHDRDGVIGAVCHGVAALLEVVDADGRAFLAGRRLTGFTNLEELFLMQDARSVFPFLLADALRAREARFVEGGMYLENTVIDRRLVTGQNPWSTWSVAEGMIAALGHEPLARERTSEELAIEVLGVYHQHGIAAARALNDRRPDVDKRLLLMHAMIAVMEGRVTDAYRLQSLARR